MMQSFLVQFRRLRVDWFIVAAVAGLIFFGGAFVLSAAIDEYEVKPILETYFFRQLIFYAVGLVMAVLIVVVDYHRLAGWSRAVYWLTIIMLVLVLIPGIGEVRQGARRWLDLGVTVIQPSEFAKLAFIFALADFLTRPHEEMLMPGVFLKALGMTALPFLLILKEPDLGSSLVFFPIMESKAVSVDKSDDKPIPSLFLEGFGFFDLISVTLPLEILFFFFISYTPPKFPFPKTSAARLI